MNGDSRGVALTYYVALVVYAFAVWLHIPYAGGHLYSDLVTVFQVRECPSACTLPIPYVQAFAEYPVIVTSFMYSMGVLGRALPGDLLINYYFMTTLFLSVPTFLLIRETIKIAELVGTPRKRALRFLVVTPSFVVVLLLNWYVIGVFFASLGIRKFLEGKTGASGVLLGLSAASNLVTAVPAIGLLVSAKDTRRALQLIVGGVLSFGLVNLPFVIANPANWLAFWRYHYNWYIEGSWMLLGLPLGSPLRHPVSTSLFVVLMAMILFRAFRSGLRSPLTLAWLSTFAFLFSTYVFTPQMNLILLPFFVLVPIAKRYWEFLAFDLVNAMVIVLGYSQALLVFGITYSFPTYGPTSVVELLAIIRSLWVGKFLLWNGLLRGVPSTKVGGGERR